MTKKILSIGSGKGKNVKNQILTQEFLDWSYKKVQHNIYNPKQQYIDDPDNPLVIKPKPKPSTTGTLKVHVTNEFTSMGLGQWKVDNLTDYIESDTVIVLSEGSYTISFENCLGWLTPESENITIIKNQQTEINITYLKDTTPIDDIISVWVCNGYSDISQMRYFHLYNFTKENKIKLYSGTRMTNIKYHLDDPTELKLVSLNTNNIEWEYENESFQNIVATPIFSLLDGDETELFTNITYTIPENSNLSIILKNSSDRLYEYEIYGTTNTSEGTYIIPFEITATDISETVNITIKLITKTPVVPPQPKVYKEYIVLFKEDTRITTAGTDSLKTYYTNMVIQEQTNILKSYKVTVKTSYDALIKSNGQGLYYILYVTPEIYQAIKSDSRIDSISENRIFKAI